MSTLLDSFVAQYFARNPVNATFTGEHGHDDRLPAWSPADRAGATRDRRDLGRALDASYDQRANIAALRGSDELLDAVLASAYLDVQNAEEESGHFLAKNPCLWTGEAIFACVSLMLRPAADHASRLAALGTRLSSIPSLLDEMKASLPERMPTRWVMRAQRECEAATWLFSEGLDMWLTLDTAPTGLISGVRHAARSACEAFEMRSLWLHMGRGAPESAYACGAGLFDTLLRRGHFSARGASELLAEAEAALPAAQDRLAVLSLGAGADPVPLPEDYLPSFARTWDACRAVASEHDLVTWPDWPIRYVPFPAWAQGAAPQLYWLFYRSPAPFDAYDVHDYFVNPGWPASTIKLNHVVHHGALGHHVQNWHARHRSRTRIGTLAAVDCASRIGMFLGGSLAEGWACYATELMDECGFLNPSEQASQQQTRVRMLARAIVDIRLHTRGMSTADAVRFYVDEVGMSRDAAEGEVTKNSMFPCTALMYWLGTKTLLELRATMQKTLGASFGMKAFHDEVLSYGAIPAALIARLMSGG